MNTQIVHVNLEPTFSDHISKDVVHECLEGVKDARLTRMYSFLPASWAGDTHEETDFLPIGNREEKEG